MAVIDGPFPHSGILLYTEGVAVVWDHGKSISNLAKHGIPFAEAVPVLEDPLGVRG